MRGANIMLSAVIVGLMGAIIFGLVTDGVEWLVGTATTLLSKYNSFTVIAIMVGIMAVLGALILIMTYWENVKGWVQPMIAKIKELFGRKKDELPTTTPVAELLRSIIKENVGAEIEHHPGVVNYEADSVKGRLVSAKVDWDTTWGVFHEELTNAATRYKLVKEENGIETYTCEIMLYAKVRDKLNIAGFFKSVYVENRARVGRSVKVSDFAKFLYDEVLGVLGLVEATEGDSAYMGMYATYEEILGTLYVTISDSKILAGELPAPIQEKAKGILRLFVDDVTKKYKSEQQKKDKQIAESVSILTGGLAVDEDYLKVHRQSWEELTGTEEPFNIDADIENMKLQFQKTVDLGKDDTTKGTVGADDSPHASRDVMGE